MSFDFLEFCRVHNVEPIVTDVWGKQYHLIKDNIKIIFFESVVKMWKYYDSWDHYKEEFKKNNCKCGKTNYEEEYIADKCLNYQYIQTLTDVTDEEIQKLTAEDHERILNLTKNSKTMLETLKADEESEQPFKAALALYPELLREAYAKESLKNIRKRMILDAKSGRLRCENKRLFACPDLYAVSEHIFLHEDNPKGLLKNGEIACKIFRRHTKADVLRSPHLGFDHALRNIVQDQSIYDWFYTNACYLSIHDLITRILQADFDGDQLNVVVDPLFVSIADRNREEFDAVPLFYDAEKAPAEIITYEAMYHALKRAHDYSAGEITSIGEISNMLTRLWNKKNPDREVANLLCMFNNLVIDAAKTGKINHYKNYPQKAKRIGRAVGGKTMPAFFKFSKNGRKDTPRNRKKKYAEPNNSTMNRICKSFDDIGNIDLRCAGVPPFNWQMLLSEPCTGRCDEAVELFCIMDNSNISNIILSQENVYANEKQLINGYTILAEDITEAIKENFGSLENVYPYIVRHLFAGEGANKTAHKRMFWRVFGDIALRILKQNLFDCDICPDCKVKVPGWVKDHVCNKNASGFFECEMCHEMFEKKRGNGGRCRCDECQEIYRKEQKKLRQRLTREQQKELALKRTIRFQSSSTET